MRALSCVSRGGEPGAVHHSAARSPFLGGEGFVFRDPGFGFRASSFGGRAWSWTPLGGCGSWVIRVRCSGLGDSCFDFRISDFVFRVQGSRPRVQGFGFRGSGGAPGVEHRLAAASQGRRPSRTRRGTAGLSSAPARSILRRAHTGNGVLSSYTKVYSVIYDSGSVPDSSIFSPRETLPELRVGWELGVGGLKVGGQGRATGGHVHPPKRHW